ncbi:MAG TPA: DUF58 domain-containing protein [Pirellulaceae bacterium]|nr:DUF58 domain-containing protein [Pirellulaceae bacterium]HMO91448.1 DUF58 domain-containing protein [Pirellulaceae bacterium]HMP69475.1 DUF58 domain-containing protein [Pirellulaceae bacterium]
MSKEKAPSQYLDAKTLDKIKRLDVRARLVVEGFITGNHRSPYNGFAVEFATHREYSPGDDLRHIDWKVWSKSDRLYIKEYEEETNLKCNIIVDCSKSMRYGETTGWSKFDYASTLAASLAYLLQQQQDAVSLILFSNKVDKMLKPSASASHLKLMLHELENTVPSDKTDVDGVFQQLAAQIRQRGLVVLVSDLFLDVESLNKALQQFRLRRHEVIVFHVMHDDELTFPFDENTKFRGLEESIELLTEPRALRKSYLEAVEEYLKQVKKACAVNGVDHVLADAAKPLDAMLSSYLNFRQRRRKNLLRR